ncbi:MAG: DNA repair exonuclease [bacterium]
MNTRILFCGDMHLGRAPARLPVFLPEYDLRPHDLGPAAAWRATVDFACDQQLDAVVLAGDLVESDNARFEAAGHLQRGVQRLVAAGIDLYAVAGNHDVEALPRLAPSLAGFHLLGQQGNWSSAVIQPAGGPPVKLLGWSFPTRRVATSPLADGLPPDNGELPVLGVLHCDLEASGSDYAPVRRSDLIASYPRGWFLGHIHRPTLHENSSEPGYLGSLVGLDPTEQGRHGPWLVEITPGGEITRQQLPLAPLRWERVDIPVDRLENPAHDLQAVLTAGLLDYCQQLGDELACTRLLGCRVHLTGRCPAPRQLDLALANGELDRLVVSSDNVLCFLAGGVVNDSLPRRDLQRLALGNDPPALLARQLHGLTSEDEYGAELIRAARRQLRSAGESNRFRDLAPLDLTDESVRCHLIKAGFQALEEILAQREESA